MRKRFPEPMWTSPTWKEEIKSELFTAEYAESAEVNQVTRFALLIGVLGDLGGKFLSTV